MKTKICLICKEKFESDHPARKYCQKKKCMAFVHCENMKRYFLTHPQKDYHKKREVKNGKNRTSKRSFKNKIGRGRANNTNVRQKSEFNNGI
jgi:hypothetical protein